MAKTGSMSRKPDHGPDDLYALRHSTAHVMAGAVLELFPEAKFGFGPPVTDGFYYDFDLPRPLQPDDLAKIEERMQAMVKKDVPFEQSEMDVPQALDFFGKKHQDYKVDQIQKLDETIEAGKVGIYTHADFVDLCRGPHVERTGKIGPFKLMSVAGAYWRGDEHNAQLQRIYGTVWPDQQQLDAYLERLKEIERRDHRSLGRDLELFRIDEELGSGLVLWLPNLSIVREELETWWRAEHRKRGYTLVYTPHIAHEKIYQRSGHLEKYGENMYGPLPLDEAGAGAPGHGSGQNFWIKPMNCPGHIKVFQSKIHSYRDLPMRIGELGTVYRYERGGTLHGMLRVRGFTQDDSHIFCSWDQAQDEIGKVFDLAMEFLRIFGYTDPAIYLATRPEKRLGTDDLWDKAEDALRKALGIREVAYKVDEGGGVFYAPKIDIKMRDAIGREWQGPTIQIDLNLPERFDVTFVNEQGQRERAVMIHRVLFGSLERFVGGLIEHYAGNFPLWLAPVQVRILPVGVAHHDGAQTIALRLREAGYRADVGEPTETIGKRIRSAELEKVPFVVVYGDRESEDSLAVRGHGGEQETLSLADFVTKLATL
jgi:threonyl-tRNA synthetase